jgi:hypothetical protein
VHLVIVRRDQLSLHGYLLKTLAPDPHVTVLVDRRCRQPVRRARAERRRRVGLQHDLEFRWVVVRRVVHPVPGSPSGKPDYARGGADDMSMVEGDVIEHRQRVERWTEEGQYLMGRVIPTFLADHERLRQKTEGLEQECERLQQELGDLRRVIGDLQSDNQQFRTEQAAIAEAFGRAMGHMSQMLQPMNEVLHKLHGDVPAGINGSAS